MDHYNQLFLELWAPLITIQVPEKSGAYERLLHHLDQFNISHRIWDNSILKNRLLNTKYMINEVIGDSNNEVLTKLLDDKQNEGHSVLSPFNVHSDLFPNGILSDKWFQKYHTLKPFAIIQTLELPEDNDGDEALAVKINDLKNSYGKLNIKYIGIIISNSKDETIDEGRINKLRQLTGLTRITGLLYLNQSSPETLDRDSELLITGMVSNIKNSAVEFYQKIEQEIKQRHRKYYSIPSSTNVDTTVELTPKFLETRNLIKLGFINQIIHPHNLEGCIHSFEVAYQNLIEILTDNFFEFSKDKFSNHDLNLYNQIRNLIDIVAFNIVRSYLSIEEPIIALKKHKAHILNIIDATKNRIDLNQWISVQYQWLAELLTLIPQSILTYSSINTYKKKYKDRKLVKFFGGVRVDDGKTEILLNPGLIYMKAISCLCKTVRKSISNDLDYLKVYNDSKSISNHKLQLLLKASESITYIDGEQKSIEGTLRYIYFLIAEEYLNDKLSSEQLQKAIEYYKKAIEEYSLMDTVGVAIYQKLISCYEELDNTEEALKLVLKLSINNKSSPALKPISLENISEKINLESDSCCFFNIASIFTDENTCLGNQSDTTVYDKLVVQILLKPAINKEFLQSYLMDKDTTKISLTVDNINVSFSSEGSDHQGGLHDMEVINDDSIDNSQLQVVKDDGDGKGKANLKIYDKHDSYNDFKVIEVSQLVKKSGTYKIKNLQINSRLLIETSGKTIEISNTNGLDGSIVNEPSLYNWIFKKVQDSVIKVPIPLKNPLYKTVKVSPVKPNVIVTMKSPKINAIILGEKLTMPFEVQFKNEKNVKYNRILLSPRIKVVCNEVEEDLSLINPTINWKGMKDDEPLLLNDLEESQIKSTHLNIGIHSTSLHAEEMLKKSDKTYRIVIDLKTLVVEQTDADDKKIDQIDDNDDRLEIYDTATYELPVLNKPFSCKYAVRPRSRESRSNDMPNPFILHDHEHNHLSMPIVTRLWLGYLTLFDKFTEYQQSNDSLQVVNIEFSIKSKNPDIQVEMIPSESDNNTINQTLFTTKSKNGVSHRNVNIIASANIEWKRNQRSEVNRFKTEEWEIVLPLSDPRVLLNVEPIDLSQKSIKLKYIIENPTPRIFSFSTKLIDENERFVWDFNDKRNVFPLTQQKFPVLPFNRFMIEFYGKYNTTSTAEIIQLPLFKVYDVQYKVSLPTLPVTNDISIRDNNTLYWKIKP